MTDILRSVEDEEDEDCSFCRGSAESVRTARSLRTFVAHTESERGTLLYQSWQSAKEDQTESLHVMQFADADAELAHSSSEAVKAFREVLYPPCVQTPKFEDRNPVSLHRQEGMGDGR